MATGLQREPLFQEDDYSRRMKSMEISRMRGRPELRTSFDYSQLDEKYPVRDVAGRYQIEERRRQERPYLLEDLEYKKTLLEERAAELGIKKAARDLERFEIDLNRQDMILEQVPLARQKIGQLDPRDPNFQSNAMKIMQEHPMAWEDDSFVREYFNPLLNRQTRLRDARVTVGDEITKEDFDKAAMLLRDKETKRLADKENDAASKVLLLKAQETVDRYLAQEGFDPETNTFKPRMPAEEEMEEDIYAPVPPRGGRPMSPLESLRAITGE
jgi:hypothetical protein